MGQLGNGELECHDGHGGRGEGSGVFPHDRAVASNLVPTLAYGPQSGYRLEKRRIGGAVEWCGHSEPSVWQRSDKIVAMVMRNAPLTCLGKWG